jgi:hypothetical protein
MSAFDPQRASGMPPLKVKSCPCSEHERAAVHRVAVWLILFEHLTILRVLF